MHRAATCGHFSSHTFVFKHGWYDLGKMINDTLWCALWYHYAAEVAQKRAKKYKDKIAVPDEDDTASDQDWNFKAIESMSNRKGRNRLKNVEIKI